MYHKGLKKEEENILGIIWFIGNYEYERKI